MPARRPRYMSLANIAPSQPPSEAQSRGIYGSCHSPTSNVTHLGRYELKRSPNEEASGRAVKRRRDVEEGEEDNDDESIAPLDNVKMHRGFMSFQRAGMVTLEKIVIPSRSGSEHRQTSQPRNSVSNGGEGAIEITTDPFLQQFLHTPIPDPNTNHPPRIPSQAQDQPPQAPTDHSKDFIPTSAPTEPFLADDSLVDTIEARMRAFEEEERAKQHQHEEDLARRRLQQKQELERELEEKIKQMRHEADVARRAAVQKQEEDHERMMEQLRRR